MTFWKPEYENIGGFGDPTSRYPLGEEHMSKLKGAALDRAVANAMGLKSVHNCEKWGEDMTGFQSKQAVAQAKLTDDDDIQDYKREWVGLTDEEIWKTVSRIGTSGSDVNPYAKLADARAIEAKLKEKNT